MKLMLALKCPARAAHRCRYAGNKMTTIMSAQSPSERIGVVERSIAGPQSVASAASPSQRSRFSQPALTLDVSSLLQRFDGGTQQGAPAFAHPCAGGAVAISVLPLTFRFQPAGIACVGAISKRWVAMHNKRINCARTARPTRKVRCTLLAGYARR